MLTVDEALEAVQQRARPLPSRTTTLDQALGCLLAEDVTSDLDLPPFDKALVDGYAVRASDLEGTGRRLHIGEEITAGRTPTRPLGPGEAAPITTGAPLPPGADSVVMLEHARQEGGRIVVDDATVATGQNRLVRGREARAGEVVLGPGTLLQPVRLGLLASVGRTRVAVRPRPRVAVVPTGDELVEPDRVPGPGQIRNSNAVMLQALSAASGAEAQCLPIARDEPGPLGEALRLGLAADVLLITGGVSAGRLDLVPEALERLGVQRVFHKVRLKPGKPLWFGTGPARGDAPGTLVFGLPGNPVSGVVGFLLFVRPALAILAGQPPRMATLAGGRLARPFEHRGDRPTYHPARRVADDAATGTGPGIDPLDWAGSADLRTVALADGFAVFPAGDRRYDRGEPIDFLPLE